MDKKVFFDIVRGQPRGTLKQEQVDGLNYILDNAQKWLEKEDFLRKMAYILATVKHETANTYQPVMEYGTADYLQKKKYYPYVGRGYVQLTWRENYEKVGAKLGLDLVQNPDWAMKPELALQILFRGMQEGWFNKSKLGLGEYMKTESYEDDRRTVNVTDRASIIAKYAVVFEKALRESGFGITAPEVHVCPTCKHETETWEKVPYPTEEKSQEADNLLKFIWQNVKWIF
jgi:hypothetical protein